MNNNECFICYEEITELDANISTLLCGHKFHYDCIVESYQHSDINNIRRCPYCRKNGGWLKQPLNSIFIEGVHKDLTLCKGTKKRKCKNKGIYNGYCAIHRYINHCNNHLNL